MRPQDIAAMINQLAASEAAATGADAASAVVDVIRAAWDERMRGRLADLVAEGGAGLSEIALEAARRACGPDDPAA